MSSDRYSQLTVEHTVFLPACISRAAARFFRGSPSGRERGGELERGARREPRGAREADRLRRLSRAHTLALFKTTHGDPLRGDLFSVARSTPAAAAREAKRGEARSETTRAHKASPPRKLHSRFFILARAPSLTTAYYI